jgi:hypothetical protein
VKGDFYRVLTAAIRDLSLHGFDSQERLERWLKALAEAARTTLTPENVLARELASRLQQAYERTVGDRSKLLRLHPGVGQFTLQQILPKLRGELDRRILASASLIKLNRQASIQKTLQRFAGWASSIPAGGSKAVDRPETNDDIRRGIAGLEFETRRVIADQGHKLVASIHNIVAVEGGAIAAVWHHTMEGGGYQARPEHVDRDGDIFVIRSNWALERGLMKLDGRQYTDQIEAPAELPYCRCRYRYLYNLRSLPESMITAVGRSELARVRAAIGA